MKSVTPVTLQALNSYLWLVATTLDRADVTLFHHCRKFQWTAWKRKDKGPDTSPPVRNTNQRGFVSRRLHLRTPWHTRPEPIFPVIQKSSEFLGMPEKSWMGVYFDVEMPKIRSQDLAGGQPRFPINSRTFKLFFSLLGSNYPNLNVWDEKYLKYKMISFWKLLYEGLPTFMHFQKKECAACVLFIISSQLTLFSFQHARNVNQHVWGEKSHPWGSNSVSHTKAELALNSGTGIWWGIPNIGFHASLLLLTFKEYILYTLKGRRILLTLCTGDISGYWPYLYFAASYMMSKGQSYRWTFQSTYTKVCND